MAILNIEGRKVRVDDSFKQMSPAQQQATVEGIAQQLGIGATRSGQVNTGPAQTEQAEMGTGADVANQFSRHFNKGLYDLANAPTHLANLALGGVDWLAEQAGGDVDYRFRPPLEAIAPDAHEAIVAIPDAQTALGQVAGTVGEYVGANAIPSMGVIAAAPKVAALTGGATSTLGQVANNAARSVAATPGTAMMGETVSSVGAGLGAQLGKDLDPNGPMGEFVGATLGGFAAPWAVAVAPTNLARKGVGAVVDRLNPNAMAQQQRQKVAAGIANDLTPEGQEAINRTAEIQELVPEYEPSLAEATESPSFIASQRELEANLSGPDLDQAARRYGLNEAALQQAVRQNAPKSSLDPTGVFNQQRNRVDSLIDRLSVEQQRVQMGERYVADSMIPTGTRRGYGETIRNEILQAKGATSERMHNLANSMGLNNQNALFDFASIRDRLKTAAQPRSQLSDPSAIPTRLLDDIESMKGQASIVDLMELRTRIDTDIREAQRLPTGQKRLPYLQAMKAELDNAVDEVIRATGNQKLADDLLAFRDIYREQFVEQFSQGAIGRALQKDGTGTYKIPDEQVAAEFFNGWNQTAAAQFNSVFPNPSNAHAAMEAVALDRLYAHSVRDGVLNPALIQSWKRQNGGVLQSFPNISGKIDDFESAVQSLSQRRADLLDRQKQVERSYLARELQRIDNPTTQTAPDSVIDEAIKNPAQMSRLLNSVKQPEARAAIARYVWEEALNQRDPLEFLKRNGLSISQALGDKYATARKLAEAIKKNQLVPRPQGMGIDPNPVADLEGVLGTGLNQISSRVFAVQSGRTSSRYAIFDVMGRAFRTMTGDAARKAMQEALYDPQIASDLAAALQMKSMTPESAQRLYTFLISNGLIAGQNVLDMERQGNGAFGIQQPSIPPIPQPRPEGVVGALQPTMPAAPQGGVVGALLAEQGRRPQTPTSIQTALMARQA